MSRRPKRAREPVFDSPAGPVLVRTVFERFPVTVKGAFVLRGGDINPHVARIVRASIARTPSGPEKPIVASATAMDIAPRIDLFLPFEASIAELEPSWYAIRCELQVDGGHSTEIDSRPFSVMWPRGTMATGSATVGEKLKHGGQTLTVDRVDLRSDRVEVLWRSEDPIEAEPPLAVLADGIGLEALAPTAVAAEPGPGRRRSIWYPAPRGTRLLSIELGGRDAGRARVSVPLG